MKPQRFWLILLFSITAFCFSACAANQEVFPGNNTPDNTQESILQTSPPAAAGNTTPANALSLTALIESFEDPITAAGDLLIIYGQVADQAGAPLSNAAVEFWQTDSNGIYDHPGDPNTANRDTGFQFFGTAITNENGSYSFRTIVPGQYEPRPLHIHVKIKSDGRELLTTQLYFKEFLPNNGAGSGLEALAIATEQTNTQSGTLLRLGTFNFYVSAGSQPGTHPLTPSQMEGPYYPVIGVGGFDNDLASVNQ